MFEIIDLSRPKPRKLCSSPVWFFSSILSICFWELGVRILRSSRKLTHWPQASQSETAWWRFYPVAVTAKRSMWILNSVWKSPKRWPWMWHVPSLKHFWPHIRPVLNFYLQIINNFNQENTNHERNIIINIPNSIKTSDIKILFRWSFYFG